MAIASAPPIFIEHLSALKDHYEAILSEYESQVLHAQEQLAHINALSAAPVPSGIATAPKVKTTAKKAPAGKRKIPRRARKAKVAARQPTTRRVATPKTSGPPMKLAMSVDFDGLSKIEAVERVFKDNVGKVLHIEDVIERLYGNLSASELKAERIRMKDVMARGTRRGMWAKVDKVPLSYILESAGEAKKTTTKARKVTKKNSKRPAKPARKAPASKAKAAKSSSGSVQLKLLPPYRKMGMTLAVENILKEHPGKPMTADEVSIILYGNLKPKHIPVAKKRLHDIFSKGVKKKRWKRVPNQKGAYLLT